MFPKSLLRQRAARNVLLILMLALSFSTTVPNAVTTSAATANSPTRVATGTPPGSANAAAATATTASPPRNSSSPVFNWKSPEGGGEERPAGALRRPLLAASGACPGNFRAICHSVSL